MGVDIGGRQIKAVQMSHGLRGRCVEATAVFARSEVNAPPDRAEVRRLAQVLRRRSFLGNEIVLAVPGDKQITGTMELPARSAAISFDAAARMEFSRAYKCEQNTFEMAYWDLPAPARAARTTNVMAVACAHADADALLDLFAAEGLEVIGLDTRPWAMARACVGVDDAAGIVVLLEIGWNAALLVILHGGVVIYERTLAESGLSVLEGEIQSSLKLEPEVTQFALFHSGLLPLVLDEAVFKEAASVPAELRGEVRGVASAHFERIIQELTQSISYTTGQYPDAAVSRLLLMGGGAMIPGIADHVQGIAGFETRVVTPLASATCAAAVARECGAAMTTAAGLAMFDAM